VNTTSRSLAHPFAGRPGHVPRALAWPKLRDHMRGRRAVGHTAVVAGTTLLVSACLWVAGVRGVWLGFLIGIVFAVFVSAVAWLAVEHSGARAPLVGAVGESWSAETFRSLSKRWVEIDSVPFEHVDVDHVLISDAGVFAVETKFTSVEWSDGSSGFRAALVDARQRARKIKYLLASSGRPAVTPMLVIWGPGAPAIPGGYSTVEDVLVCRGASPKPWLAHLEGLPRTTERDAVTRMVAVVRERVRVAASAR
jgi:hypothetical protein